MKLEKCLVCKRVELLGRVGKNLALGDLEKSENRRPTPSLGEASFWVVWIQVSRAHGRSGLE